MIRRLLDFNDASFIYLCDFEKMKQLLDDADLTETELLHLKNTFAEHERRAIVFEQILQKRVNKLIENKNLKIKTNEQLQRKTRQRKKNRLQ